LQLADVPCNVKEANVGIKIENSGFFEFNHAAGFGVPFTGAVDVFESYLFSMRFRTILYQKLSPDETEHETYPTLPLNFGSIAESVVMEL